jgi:hypothetical protein
MKRTAVWLALGLFACSAQAFAADAANGRGERIERRLDRRGEVIDHRLDRAARRAANHGHDVTAERLDARGDRADRRLDRRGSRIERRLDRR